MDSKIQPEKAAAFRALHDRSRILVLPNAWDAASARVFEAAGFPAVATTSAGLAWSLGYPDGEQVGRDEMVAALGRIAGRVAVPVTADVEAGFGSTPEEVGDTVRLVLAAGAVGVNLEDGTRSPARPLVDPALHVDRIQAARAVAEAVGVPLVINARTDVYLAGVGEVGERFDHAVRRANAYRAAGADCLFVPGVRDTATIGRLVRALDGPLNVLAGPGCPAVPELRELGVARVSVGSGPMVATLTLLRRLAEELAGPGTYTAFTGPAIVPYPEWNRLLAEGLPQRRPGG
jgi:2-methylisocitrate lyase-like PEP mutase family enzyme